jgi:hypothetical protein
LAGGLVTTVILFALYLVDLKNTGFDKERSQKALIADYQSRKQLEEPLVYLGPLQFSADFYSKRQAQFVPDLASLSQRIQKSPGYVAIPNSLVPNLPASIAGSLQPISVHGRYSLFVVKTMDGS